MLFAEEAIEELRTIGDLVRWGASRFSEAELNFTHGTDNALDEAFNLVRCSLSLPHDIPKYMINSQLTKAERRKSINLLVERVATKKPAAYLIQEARFSGLQFFVDERVLIPRSPIAELIEASFEPWIEPAKVTHILDLCTGCGCIAIACAFAFPAAKVTASDLSQDALEVAEINIQRHRAENNISLVESNMFEQMDPAQVKYDIIVSNPPYVDAAEIARLLPEFRYEPMAALAAGEDGLDFTKIILAKAGAFLQPEGLLVVEVGNSQISLLKQFSKVPFLWPEFERGGHGVFILTKNQIDNSQPEFNQAVEQLVATKKNETRTLTSE